MPALRGTWHYTTRLERSEQQLLQQRAPDAVHVDVVAGKPVARLCCPYSFEVWTYDVLTIAGHACTLPAYGSFEPWTPKFLRGYLRPIPGCVGTARPSSFEL